MNQMIEVVNNMCSGKVAVMQNIQTIETWKFNLKPMKNS